MRPSSALRLGPPALSLRSQLIGWVAAVLLLSFAVLFLVVYSDTARQLTEQVNRDVTTELQAMNQALAPSLNRGAASLTGEAAAVTPAARQYFAAQRYGANSPLLFVLVGGRYTLSNHPELFGSRRDDDETGDEQAHENVLGRALATARLGYTTRPLPDVGKVRVLERALPGSGGQVVLGAGLPLRVVERAQHDVARAFMLFGLVVLLLALGASYIAGWRVSAPLRRMAEVARRVNGGELAPRIDLPGGSSEMRVLASSFNNMLDRLTEAFNRQREFVADASHELRTPITVIRGQLELLAGTEEPSSADIARVEAIVAQEVARITRLIDDLLVLAQSGRMDFLHVRAIELATFVADLWEGIVATHERCFELGPVPQGELRADPDRLAQALRNLIRNAIEHTADGVGRVHLQANALDGGAIRFSVCDDGPGIPPQERERVFERFHRTDPGRARSEGGAGLGLAIVRAIARAHGGEVVARPRPGGPGAQLDLVLPGFEPAPRGDGRPRHPAKHPDEDEQRPAGGELGAATLGRA